MSNFHARHFHFIDEMDIAALVLAAVGRIERLAGRLAGALSDYRNRSRERRALAALGEHLLDDIGLTRAQVAREAAKHFWQR